MKYRIFIQRFIALKVPLGSLKVTCFYCVVKYGFRACKSFFQMFHIAVSYFGIANGFCAIHGTLFMRMRQICHRYHARKNAQLNFKLFINTYLFVCVRRWHMCCNCGDVHVRFVINVLVDCGEFNRIGK
jgi:hypothetical protein